ncbi:hypothetical protein [Rhodopila globiformis]|uniref:Uncharacterized protein n=1 Tax=Rhodopila globiformis TaxID=1071 RepID=A0A2S6N980_RHOGL|nr:hypothetical protein [Rhodopila globiformis]PPQ31173.1 hypothetical protein CCS01_17905 [Rhodopila globiformis]
MNVTDALTSAAKGAAAGAIAGPVGAAVGGLGGLVLDIAPDVGKWLFGSNGEHAATQVAKAVETVTGTSDAEAAQAVLARDPEAVTQLRVQLVTLAAQMQAEANRAAEAQRASELAMLQAAAADRANARSQTTALAQAKDRIAWTPTILSAVILVVFGALVFVVLTKRTPAPDGLMPLANILLGTVAAMATQVANYWLGSSSGSASKTDQLAALSASAQTSVPGDVVHRLIQQGQPARAGAA